MSLPFRVHLICAGTTTIICVWNLWRTPSCGAVAKAVHKALGRIAMCTSLIGLSFGYIAAWTMPNVPRASAIGLSIVGLLQLKETLIGFRAIKQAQRAKGDEKKALIEKHRAAMHGLFFGCCLGPAWFRVPGWIGLIPAGQVAPPWVQFLGVLPPFVIVPLALKASAGKRFL